MEVRGLTGEVGPVELALAVEHSGRYRPSSDQHRHGDETGWYQVAQADGEFCQADASGTCRVGHRHESCAHGEDSPAPERNSTAVSFEKIALGELPWSCFVCRQHTETRYEKRDDDESGGLAHCISLRGRSVGMTEPVLAAVHHEPIKLL
jgi:hypothetical protein